jgi:hypothetical protein
MHRERQGIEVLPELGDVLVHGVAGGVGASTRERHHRQEEREHTEGEPEAPLRVPLHHCGSFLPGVARANEP